MDKATILSILLTSLLLPAAVYSAKVGPTDVTMVQDDTESTVIKINFPGSEPGDTLAYANCKKTKMGSFKCSLNPNQTTPIIFVKKEEALIIILSQANLSICYQAPTKAFTDQYGKPTVIANVEVLENMTYKYHTNAFSTNGRQDCQPIGDNIYRCKIREYEMAVFANEEAQQIISVNWTNPDRPTLHICYTANAQERIPKEVTNED